MFPIESWILIPIIGILSVFGAPLCFYWVRRHYALLEKQAAAGLPKSDAEMLLRLAALEQRQTQLETELKIVEARLLGEGGKRAEVAQLEAGPASTKG